MSKALGGNARDPAGGRKATSARASVVRGHVRRGRTLPRRRIGANGAGSPRTWLGGRERQEDLVTLLTQRAEQRATVRLQTRVHEVGADLQLVRTHQGPQVVLPPAVEAFLALQGLGHAAANVRLQCSEPAVPCTLRLRGFDTLAQLLDRPTSFLALVLHRHADGLVTRAHRVCPSSCNHGIRGVCSAGPLSDSSAWGAGDGGVRCNHVQICLARTCRDRHLHHQVACLPVLQWAEADGSAPTLLQLAEATGNWPQELRAGPGHQVDR
mmetsp:Transcript_4676/g.13926  ORF Transcript_4676/g.13926 Transcript_4676/m.13926 type:complete len:268 (-) Transcript_4676:477-1280(-)